MEFPDGNIQGSNMKLVGLDIPAVILETDNQNPSDLIDLEAE